ncbi:MAG: CD225/dispanin family protein, partial [Trueperaceae bacterium]
GWYPDPQDATQQRYWDGSTWTEHTATGTARAPATNAAATGAAGTTAPGGTAPDTWTWQSIVVTILCCAPFGVAGALNAGRAEQALRSGDGVAAAKYANQAKKWTLWGLGVWGLVVVGYIAFFLLVIGMSGFSDF